MKTCSKCKKEKSLIEFGKLSSSSDGLKRRCKKCANKAIREWNKNNPDKSKAISKRSRKNNNKTRQKWDAKNRAKINKQAREWRSRNKDKVSAQAKKWRKNNPHKRAIQHINRRALKNNVVNDYTAKDRIATLSVFNNQCFLCKSTDNLCVDHHYPLSKGNGLSLNNAVVLCRSCNSKKYNRSPEEFYGYKKYAELNHILSTIKQRIQHQKS